MVAGVADTEERHFKNLGRQRVYEGLLADVKVFCFCYLPVFFTFVLGWGIPTMLLYRYGGRSV